MKVVFHDNSLCLRGTTVALFDYAYYCRKNFGIEPVIMYNVNHPLNDQIVIEKFKKEFGTVISYGQGTPWSWPAFPSTLEQLYNHLEEIKPDVFFMEKGGPWDGVISKNCRNWIHAIAVTNKSQVYGDKFFVGSKWLSSVSGGIDYVPYMVNLPETNENMRETLNIPKDAVVYGRNGGWDTFDLNFAKQAVIDSLKVRNDIWFVFQHTEKFVEHERVIWLDSTTDLFEKVKFINTCDALLHAREIGESFGLTCAEFSIKNKPVITWFLSKERNHIDTLGSVGIYYNNYDDLISILTTFEPNPQNNYNCYEEYLPEVVMDRFKTCYLD